MKKFLNIVLIVLITMYVGQVLINQQKSLNTYNREKQQYTKELNRVKEEQQELQDTVEKQNSIEYIEDTAREKLDMYLPNERVYIDANK